MIKYFVEQLRCVSWKRLSISLYGSDDSEPLLIFYKDKGFDVLIRLQVLFTYCLKVISLPTITTRYWSSSLKEIFKPTEVNCELDEYWTNKENNFRLFINFNYPHIKAFLCWLKTHLHSFSNRLREVFTAATIIYIT